VETTLRRPVLIDYILPGLIQLRNRRFILPNLFLLFTSIIFALVLLASFANTFVLIVPVLVIYIHNFFKCRKFLHMKKLPKLTIMKSIGLSLLYLQTLIIFCSVSASIVLTTVRPDNEAQGIPVALLAVLPPALILLTLFDMDQYVTGIKKWSPTSNLDSQLFDRTYGQSNFFALLMVTIVSILAPGINKLVLSKIKNNEFFKRNPVGSYRQAVVYSLVINVQYYISCFTVGLVGFLIILFSR
jgi:hypothetical protein